MLWVLCLSAQALLIGFILQRKLLRAYPFFVAFLSVDLGCSLVLINIPYISPAYAATFRVCQVLAAVLQLGMAGELFERLCCHFRQFRGMSPFRFYMATFLLVLTGLLCLAVFPSVPARYPQLLVVWFERWETAVLAITLALFWWVLRRFLGLKPQMRSNVLAHGTILTTYYAVSAVSDALMLVAQSTAGVRAVNLGMLTGMLGCFVAWMIYLRRDGERLLPELPVSPEALAYSRLWRRILLQYVQQAGR
ncbi:MAG: hypothetical protein JOZ32_17385 [Bryobacterales bacterium]|nr:hypothetical protein [Bryobacterales bacterium]